MALPPPSETSTCLVTGASAGIGSDLARGLARRGHGVTLIARREERLKELAAEIERDHGVNAGYVAADLADAAQRAHVVETIADRGLQVEVVANNAGFGTTGSFHKLDLARELEMVRLNIEAVVDLTGRYLPQMVERGRGAVLNIASSAAFQPMPYDAVYAASKAFVLSFSEAVHVEVKSSGVTVTAVCPGPVRTEFAQIAGTEEELRRFAPLAMSGARCAEISLKALEQGKRAVIPGLPMKLAIYPSRPLPTSIKLPFAKTFFKSHA